MNEKKKGQILLLVGLVIIVAIIGVFVVDVQAQKKVVAEYNKLYEQEGTHVVYFGREGCGYCNYYQPVIDEMTKLFEFEYNYFDSDSVNESRLVYMLNKGEVSVEDFGTPTTLIIKDGKPVANKIGYMDRDATFEFLKEHGVIAEAAVLPPEFEYLKQITYSEYANLLNSTEPKVVVIGQTLCGHCITAKPVYDEISKENGIDIYYLDYSKLTKDEATALNASTSYFAQEPDWGTPLMLILQNGDSVKYDSGFRDKATTLEFLQTAGIIK